MECQQEEEPLLKNRATSHMRSHSRHLTIRGGAVEPEAQELFKKPSVIQETFCESPRDVTIVLMFPFSMLHV